MSKPLGWTKPNMWMMIVAIGNFMEMYGLVLILGSSDPTNNSVGLGLSLMFFGMFVFLVGVCGWFGWSRKYEILERDEKEKLDVNKIRT